MIDLRKSVLECNLEELLNELLFEQVPFIFGHSWSSFRTWRRELGYAVNVDPSEVIVVGSAATGHSLSPSKALKAFDQESDVDVAIVSDHFFSEAWHHLRSLDLTLDALTPMQRAAIVDHQRRYIYWGCIATDRILSLMPFAIRWVTARSKFAAMAPTSDRDINFRIYKDFRALRGYQLLGLKRLRAALLDPKGEASAEFS